MRHSFFPPLVVIPRRPWIPSRRAAPSVLVLVSRVGERGAAALKRERHLLCALFLVSGIRRRICRQGPWWQWGDRRPQAGGWPILPGHMSMPRPRLLPSLYSTLGAWRLQPRSIRVSKQERGFLGLQRGTREREREKGMLGQRARAPVPLNFFFGPFGWALPGRHVALGATTQPERQSITTSE